MPYQPLEDGLAAKVRNTASQYDDDLVKLAKTSSDWGKFQELDRFKTPGKAARTRQALVNRWGNVPGVTGYRFRTMKVGDTEYLVALYDPKSVVEGLYETWLESKRVRTKALNDAKKVKAEEMKVRAEEFVANLKLTMEDTDGNN